MTDHVKDQLCARIEELESEKMELNEQVDELQKDRDALAAQVENWRETAAQYARNEDFYRGIVRQIGELFGEEARTSDDGSVQDDVLALKVPELVEALAAHVERLQAFRTAVCGWRESDWPGGFCRRTAELVADHGRQAERGDS